MINLLKPPFEQETLDVWAKLSDDIAKVALLAIPVIPYANNTLVLKIINILLLILVVYLSLLFGRIFRQMKQKLILSNQNLPTQKDISC